MPKPNQLMHESPEDHLLAELDAFVEQERAKGLKHRRGLMRGEKPEAPPEAHKGPEACEACARGECDDPAHLPDDVPEYSEE